MKQESTNIIDTTDELINETILEMADEEFVEYKVLEVSEYYTGDNCPNCGRNRLLTYKTDKGDRTVCEKCEWVVEDGAYLEEVYDEEIPYGI